jgi:hypothetical protein
MQDFVKTRSCQIQLDEQDKAALCTADGVNLADPTFEVIAGLPPAELTFEALSPLYFVSPFTLWQDDARIPIVGEIPSISVDASGTPCTTLVITVTPQAPPEALTYHFTMHLSDGSKNHEVGPGANEPASGDGTQYGADPTIVESPPIG